MERHVAVAGLLALALAAPSAGAAERVRLSLGGSFAPLKLDFSESRTFQQYAEDGKLDASYSIDGGPGGELGIQFNFTDNFGIAAGGFITKRTGSASYTASLPHPLYLSKPRTATGQASDLAYSETGGQLALVLHGGGSTVLYGVMAGAMMVKVEAELINEIQYSHAYPYDNVTVTGQTKTGVSDTPIGFFAGAYLDVRFGSFGLGADASFSQATAKLTPPTGDSVEVKAGGLKVGAGIRLYF